MFLIPISCWLLHQCILHYTHIQPTRHPPLPCMRTHTFHMHVCTHMNTHVHTYIPHEKYHACTHTHILAICTHTHVPGFHFFRLVDVYIVSLASSNWSSGEGQGMFSSIFENRKKPRPLSECLADVSNRVRTQQMLWILTTSGTWLWSPAEESMAICFPLQHRRWAEKNP